MAFTPDLLRDIADSVIIRRGRDYLQQGRVTLQKVTDATVSARVRGSRMYEVELSFDGYKLDYSCTCPYDWGDACKHVVATLLAAMDEHRRPPSSRLLYVPGRRTASTKKRTGPKPKAKSTPKAQAPWVKEMNSLFPRRFDPIPSPVVFQKPWRLCYSLIVSGAERQIVPLRVKQLKTGGDATPTLLKQFDIYDGVHFDLTDRMIVSRIQHSFSNVVRQDVVGTSDRYRSYGYGYYDPWASSVRNDWNDVLLMLEGKELYLQMEGNLMGKRIYARSSPRRFHVRVGEDQKGIVVEPELEWNGSIAPLSEDIVLLTKQPVWVLKDDEVFRIHGAQGDEVIAFKQKKMRVEVPADGQEAFMAKQLPRLLERYHVRAELPRFRSIHVEPRLRLYSSDEGGDFAVEVRFAYDDVEVADLPAPVLQNSLDARRTRLMRVGEDTVHVVRDVEAEGKWLAQLPDLSLRPALVRDGRTLYAPTIRPLDWLLTTVPKAQEQGFEVFGEDDLRSHRVRRDQPQLRFDISSGIDWFDLTVDVKFGGTDASLNEFVKAVVGKSRYVRLGDGSFGVLPEEWVERFAHALALFEPEENRLRFSRMHVSAVDALLDGAEEVSCDAAFDDLRKRFRTFKQIATATLPGGFTGTLRPYQKAGYDWLHFLREFGVGGILADDMGLGKTVQALALLQQRYEAGESLPSLIVVPSSPLFNWKKEAERFTPNLRVLLYTGMERHKQMEALESNNIILTSYGILRRDIETLQKREFLYVVLDESQNIKNPASVNAKAARLLRARHKIALTGTPIENNLMELWSQFTFLNPGMLGTEKAFAEHFARPIERQKSEAASASLKRIIFPFILRRTKEIVASELPPKVETITYCDMDAGQRKAYDHWREYYRRAIQKSIETVGFARSKIKVLEGLMKLRQVCCHPALADAKYTGSSGKFDVFVEMVDAVLAEGHKLLVFSQFVRLLTILRRHFDGKGIPYEYLDGRTRDRGERVERFQEDDTLKIFLISLKAGGTGLNLTAADYVIHYDPWWNPAVEMQATDRAHRIGQTKHVFAYKLITRGTVEEKVLALQEQKKDMVRNIITTDAGFMKSLTREDVEALFG